MLALNKVDIIHKPQLLPLIEHYAADWHVHGDRAGLGDAPATASTNARAEILAALPEGEALFPEDYLTDQTERDAGRRVDPRESARAHAR